MASVLSIRVFKIYRISSVVYCLFNFEQRFDFIGLLKLLQWKPGFQFRRAGFFSPVRVRDLRAI